MLMSDSVACKVAIETVNSWKEFLILSVPPLTIIVAVILVPLALNGKIRKEITWERFSLLLAFCLIGLVPGIMAGYSQQAIAGTFLTVIIGIISALLSFGFAKESLQQWRPVIPLAMILTLLGALVGFSTGGVAKNRWIIFDQKVQQTKYMNEQVRGPVERTRRELNLKHLAESDKGAISGQKLMNMNDPPLPKQDSEPESCF